MIFIRIFTDMKPAYIATYYIVAVLLLTAGIISVKIEFRTMKKSAAAVDALYNNTQVTTGDTNIYTVAAREKIIEYNNLASKHNSYIKQFPRNFYASFYNCETRPYIKIE